MPPYFFVIGSLGLFLFMLSSVYDLLIHVTEHLYRAFPSQCPHLRCSRPCSAFSPSLNPLISSSCCRFFDPHHTWLVLCFLRLSASLALRCKALSTVSTSYCRCLVCATDGGAVLRKFRNVEKNDRYREKKPAGKRSK